MNHLWGGWIIDSDVPIKVVRNRSKKNLETETYTSPQLRLARILKLEDSKYVDLEYVME